MYRIAHNPTAQNTFVILRMERAVLLIHIVRAHWWARARSYATVATPMQMHQIRYFLTLAEELNFTKAAELCHVSQPALSRAIKQLEEELGGSLFRRERSLTHLTELGRIMLPVLKQAYDTAKSAKELASAYRDGNYAPLRLAVSHTVDLGLFVDSLSQLISSFSGLQLELFRGPPGDVEEAVKSGKSELAIAGPLKWDRLRSWSLFDVNFCLFAHKDHTLADRGCVGMSELAAERLIMRPYCEVTDVLGQRLRDYGICPKTLHITSSDHDVLTLLSSDVGVAIMPTVTSCWPNLKAITLKDLDIDTSVHLHAVTGRQYSPAATAFMQLMRSADWNSKIGERSHVQVH